MNFFRWTVQRKLEVITAPDYLEFSSAKRFSFFAYNWSCCSLLENRHVKSKTHFNCCPVRANFAGDKALETRAKMNSSNN